MRPPAERLKMMRSAKSRPINLAAETAQLVLHGHLFGPAAKR
ncbi:hypothetical protein X734_31615 [Mesorhizobium sp. L2C084A000]|nr:hypothetical protein X734_31615 [Mesorhizobium sp. L2C084A000]